MLSKKKEEQNLEKQKDGQSQKKKCNTLGKSKEKTRQNSKSLFTLGEVGEM
jgi:hypothetical protein